MANAYIYGNTVRRVYEPDHVRRRVHVQEPLRRHKKRHHMSFGYLLFLSFAMIVMVGTLAFYISLQSRVTASMKNIAQLEKQLNSLKQHNDENYNRANGRMSLDEIKEAAIGFGMTYADDGQIVKYTDDGGDDYVRQLAPIPQASNK